MPVDTFFASRHKRFGSALQIFPFFANREGFRIVDGPINATGRFTANGTATSGLDYTGISGTVTFVSGVVSQPITVTVLADEFSLRERGIAGGLTEGVASAPLDTVVDQLADGAKALWH